MVSKGQEIWLVKLEGVDSPEEAELLRGHRLLIPAAARPALEDGDEFYVQARRRGVGWLGEGGWGRCGWG